MGLSTRSQCCSDRYQMGDVWMRRVEIARKVALLARAAERHGNHKRAAELFAEALRALIHGSGAGPREAVTCANDEEAEQIAPAPAPRARSPHDRDDV